MAISGVGNNYNSVYEGGYVTQKNEVSKKAEQKDTVSAQSGKAQSAKEQAVSDLYSKLQKNCSCMSDGNVAVSGEYLKKCSQDSKKAKELEDFLKNIPELEKQGYEQLSAQNKAMGGTVTYYQQTWMIQKDGSIQSTVYSVTETGMTNAEKLKKQMDERLEKQKEKKEEEKRAEEQKEETARQAEKPDEDTGKVPMPEAAGQGFAVKYVEAESETEAQAMVRKDKPEDAYYPKFDRIV